MKQITVIVDNHPGVVADITATLAEKNLNIETLNADGAEAHGVVILTVDRYNDALIALRDAGFQAITEDALVIRLKDEPGALAKVSARFKNENLNIRSIRILRREADHALVTLVTDDNERALKLLQDVVVNR